VTVNIILKAAKYAGYIKICYYIFEKLELYDKNCFLFVAFSNIQAIKRRRYIKFSIEFCFAKGI